MTTSAAPTPTAPADPWRRFMCIAYEGVLLFGVLFFFGYAFSALAQFKGQPGPVRWVFQGFLVIVLGVYFGWSWSDGRRTLPMKTMSVRVETRDGRSVSRARALARFFAALAMVVLAIAAGSALHPVLHLLVLVPFVWTIIDRDRRALYDIVAGTRLIHVPRTDARR